MAHLGLGGRAVPVSNQDVLKRHCPLVHRRAAWTGLETNGSTVRRQAGALMAWELVREYQGPQGPIFRVLNTARWRVPVH
eukprot:scaffold97647_cov30-Tisochrysis_lutea.AAC.2